jgi:Na+/phosphate symporter
MLKLHQLRIRFYHWIAVYDASRMNTTEKTLPFSKGEFSVGSLFRRLIKVSSPAELVKEHKQLHAIATMSLEQIVKMYETLAALPTLTEAQADDLQAILDLAIDNEELSSKIEAVDEDLADDRGLMSQANCESYQDQQALLNEHAGVPIRPKGAALEQNDVDERTERRSKHNSNSETDSNRQLHKN